MGCHWKKKGHHHKVPPAPTNPGVASGVVHLPVL